MEQQAAIGGEDAGIVGLLRPRHGLFPDNVAGLDVQRAHQPKPGIVRVGIVAEGAARTAINAAILGRHHIEQLGLGIEGGGIPVGGAAHARTGERTLFGGKVARHHMGRAGFGIKAVCPGELAHKGLGQQELAVGAVQHIEYAAALRRQQKLARLAFPYRVHQHHGLGGVPVMGVIGRELVVPFELAGHGVQRHHRIGVEIGAAALRRIGVGKRIAHRPIKRAGLGIVRAGFPGRAAAGFQRPADPGLGERLTRLGNGVEAPGLLAAVGMEGDQETAHGGITARNARDHQVVDDHHRSRGVDLAFLRRLGQRLAPHHRTCQPVQTDQIGVVGGIEQPIAQYAHAAIGAGGRGRGSTSRAAARACGALHAQTVGARRAPD